MDFANKPNKQNSKKLSDKRKISLLNSDFKLLIGLENKQHVKLLDHTVAKQQFTQGESKTINRAIALARNAIFAANQRKEGCAIADLDIKAAFDFLGMEWVFEVLKKKGLDPRAIGQLIRYYNNSITMPIVNNIPGRRIINQRMILRQCGCPSWTWFGFGINPLIIYLQNRLSGILIHSLPVIGPTKRKNPENSKL